uniref:Uncharacterized protein n=1 Tax=Peronospora matthiolae TaxID=2874970 RepID=A0AAV1TR42_9STRA
MSLQLDPSEASKSLTSARIMSPDAYLAQPYRKRMSVLHWMLPVLAM